MQSGTPLDPRDLVESLLVGILVVLVVIGIFSVPLSIQWQAQHTARQFELLLSSNQQKLTADYPTIIPAEDKPAQLAFSLQSGNTVSSQPITLTVKLPPGLLVVSSSQQAYRQDAPIIAFFPLASTVQTKTLDVINARLGDGSYRQTIDLFLSNETNPHPLRVTVEGTVDSALRNFFSNSQNLIFVAFASVAGLVVEWIRKQRDAEEEKEKAKEAEEKKKALQAKKDFLDVLSRREVVRAQAILENLKESKLIERLESRDSDLMRRLLDLTKEQPHDWKIESIIDGDEWWNAYAGALLYAFDHGKARDEKLRETLRQLPMTKLSGDLQIAINDALGGEQKPVWPPRVSQQQLDSQKAKLEKWRNPFCYDRAEDDEAILFPNVYWNEFGLFERVSQTNKTTLVAGELGIGKTAMALALGKYQYSPNTLATYLPGLPEEGDIECALTNALFDFIRFHPAMLRNLGRDERTLLASVLANILDSQIVLAKLEAVPMHEIPYVYEVEGEERKKRESILHSQLQFFREVVMALPPQKSFSHRAWGDALVQCAQALDFQPPIRIVIDANSNQCAEWLDRVILPRVAQWRMMNIVATIFVPNSVELPTENSDWLGYLPFTWTTDELANLLDHRFEQIIEMQGKQLKRNSVIQDDFWKSMIVRTNCNPGVFMRTARKMHALEPQYEKWDEALLNRALE